MTVLHAIIAHCETLMRTQSGTEYLRGEISKIRDLAQSGLASAGDTVDIRFTLSKEFEPPNSVTPEPIASQTDAERHLDSDETPE